MNTIIFDPTMSRPGTCEKCNEEGPLYKVPLDPGTPEIDDDREAGTPGPVQTFRVEMWCVSCITTKYVSPFT